MRISMSGWIGFGAVACVAASVALADGASTAAAAGAANVQAVTAAPVVAPAPATPAASAPVAPAKPATGSPSKLKGTVEIGTAKQADWPDLAKVQLQYAIRAAMTKVQGKLLKVGLEAENGFLIWEVELVKSDKSMYDVKVDAGSGAVLAVEQDEPDTDRAKPAEGKPTGDGAAGGGDEKDDDDD